MAAETRVRITVGSLFFVFFTLSQVYLSLLGSSGMSHGE